MEKINRTTLIKPITCHKIVIMGPESTGKTTLCQALASHFNTVWVPEYLRTYCQQNWENNGVICTWDDLVPILEGQLREEAYYLPLANHMIFLDTNILTLYVNSLIYYQCVPQAINLACAALKSDDIYFLANTDVPWEYDVLRDQPHQRDWILEMMKNILQKYQFNFSLVTGSLEERMHQIERNLRVKGII